MGIVQTRHLSRAFISDIHRNPLFSFIYNVAGVAVEVGIFVLRSTFSPKPDDRGSRYAPKPTLRAHDCFVVENI